MKQLTEIALRSIIKTYKRRYRLETIAFIILAVLYIILIAATIINNKRRKSELSEQLKDLTLNVNKTAKTTLINSPFPLIIIEANGNIIWRSEKFNN